MGDGKAYNLGELTEAEVRLISCAVDHVMTEHAHEEGFLLPDEMAIGDELREKVNYLIDPEFKQQIGH